MYKESPADKISRKLTPSMRKLEDFNIRCLGTKTQLLRISVSTPDLYGDTNETLKTEVINNVIIKHPWGSNVQVFNNINESTQQTDASAINLWDLLPVEIKFPFNGDQTEDPIHLQKGDMLVECIFDEHGSKVPLIFEVTRLYVGTFIKQVVTKKVECTLYRGTPSNSIVQAINIYLQGLRNE